MGAKPEVDPEREAAFRRAYRRGWLGAADALAQLCEERQLPAAVAARVLRAHHEDALAKWQSDPLGIALYPPRVSVKRAKAEGAAPAEARLSHGVCKGG